MDCLSFVMADGGNVGAGGRESPWRKTALHCPGVLLKLGCHCLSAHCHLQHSSQERLMKISTTLLWLPFCTDACMPWWRSCDQGNIFCHPFGILIVACFDSLWKSWHLVPHSSTIETPGGCES